MQYRRDKYGNDLSVLGYGCMRFTQTAGRIDLEKAEEEIMAAFRGGVNYFDTAYIYGGSEAALGEILERNGIRDRIYIATKLPHYLIRSGDNLDKYFEEQCRRLRTDYIDYYLMHMLTDVQTWERLKGLGILEWIREKRERGAIRQVGFSYHGNADMFCQLVDAFDWDFCQIQYNYMDENSQAGRRGLQYAHGKGLPVIIMEPLRGGKLVNRLPEAARKIFSAHRVADRAEEESGPGEALVEPTPAQWALKWLWNQPEVTCVLSGMNSVEMVEENLHTAEHTRAGELTEADQAMLRQVVEAINARMKVGCTGCGYCMPCPHGVDIPTAFRCYNQSAMHKKISAMLEYIQITSLKKDATSMNNCTKCGACEKHCPQHIEIRKELQNAKKALQPFYIRAVLKLVNRLVKR